MPTSDELRAAVSAGVIGQAEADRLAAFLATYRSGRQPADAAEMDDAEAMRFVRGFHDVFLTIGVTLLLIGIGSTMTIFAPGLWFYAVAIAAWLLAEYFTGMKRLMLPSIVLSIAFGITCGIALMALTLNIIFSEPLTISGDIREYQQARGTPSIFASPPLHILLASLLFFARFRLPFTLAQIAVATAVLAGISFNSSQTGASPLLLIGLLAFTVALLFDLKDPERQTIASDNAFWLHLTAAPLIVHTTITTIVGYNINGSTVDALSLPLALTILAVIGGLAFIALLIDRRALLVSGLFYFGAALFVLIRNTALESNAVLAVTLLVLGAALLLLGVGWRILRRLAVETLMPPAVARRLPTIRPS